MASPGEGTVVAERYTLVRKIGTGGMADVWLARDTELDREVAIKILHDRFAQDAEFVERFRREARSAAGLQHPNVVSIFDRGELGDTYFIAMEYVDGPSLKELVRGGMRPQDAIDFTRQILAAAGFAHRKGIVHRDLKPQNVLIDDEGRAKVADFGIARGEASDITQEGSVMGTAQYLSPEQAQGRETTARSDLYSIGVILYEALTGRVPFEGDSAVAVALKQVSDVPRRPSAINPKVPPALDAVVMRALAKDPEQRFLDADAFLAALAAAEKTPEHPRPEDTAVFAAVLVGGEHVPPPGPAAPDSEEQKPRRRWLRWAIVALLVAGVAGLIAFALTRPERVTIPSVTGRDSDTAVALLESRGFDVDLKPVSSSSPRGIVTEMNPPAGSRVDEGSTVELSVSSGPALVEVPDVRGLTQQQATKRLEDDGFLVSVARRFSDQVDRGRAIGTEPGAGTVTSIETTVTLVISRGTNKVEVPDLVGLGVERALADLEALELGGNAVSRDSDAPAGEVLSQSPSAGSLAQKGTQVTIFVSTGIIEVPGVIGLPRQRAVNILKGDGFRVAVRDDPAAPPEAAGLVTDQFPPQGSSGRRGDRITIFVGAPPPPATIP